MASANQHLEQVHRTGHNREFCVLGILAMRRMHDLYQRQTALS